MNDVISSHKTKKATGYASTRHLAEPTAVSQNKQNSRPPATPASAPKTIRKQYTAALIAAGLVAVTILFFLTIDILVKEACKATFVLLLLTYSKNLSQQTKQ